jgi:hypothetical protein
MIELFVNNHEVLLPEDLEVVIIEENPEITNNGEFTLDITLSLLEAKNAIAFGFLNRKNLTTINKSADARMIIDGEVRFGTVVILRNTDVDVSFQFVAGNSELNYNAKFDNRKIWELNWGTESAINFTRAKASIEAVVSERNFNFVCTPVVSGVTILNNYMYDQYDSMSGFIGIENIVMQPFILYYINKLPELLGYSIAENVLNEDERALRMYLVNSVNSLNYGDALPDMSISDFINGIESFFNVTFIINSIDKTVSIKNFGNSLPSKEIVNVGKGIDSYVRDFDSKNLPSKIGYSKIEYELHDNLVFKYQKLTEKILSKCQILEFSSWSAFNSYVINNTWVLNFSDKFILYKIGDDVFASVNNINVNLYKKKAGFIITHLFSLVNKLESVGDDDSNVLTLKISPAEIIHYRKEVNFVEGLGGDIYSIPQYQLPKSRLSLFTGDSQGLTNAIETSLKEIPRNTNIEVSLFTGMIEFEDYPYRGDEFIDPHLKYPFSHIDKYVEYGARTLREATQHYPALPIDYPRFEEWLTTHFIPSSQNSSMRLEKVIEDYHQENILDTSKEYTFTLVDSPDVRADKIFVIDGRKYIPISLERRKSNKSATVTGKFYAMLAE